MKFQITHFTKYQFSENVFFEPHQFRFKPRNSKNIKLESFKINVSPAPVGLSEQLDAENNYMHLGWFEGMHSKMEIHAEFELISFEFNPFDFLIYPMNYAEVPFKYLGNSAHILAPYLEHSKLDKQLFDFGNEVLSESKNTVDFISNTTRKIHNKFTVIERLKGEPHDPEKTFKLREGSCRDLAWMQINLLRNFGIATRFVSGYCFIDSQNNANDLHAWCEAFVPGAGWIGFDPSHGVLTANNYIPVASSAFYSNTMPVAGSVRGSATSELVTDLKIEVVG